LDKAFFEHALNDVYQKEWSRTLAFLVKRTGNISIAEDCAQDAFESAVQHWRKEGFPDSPGAWLRTVAFRQFIDGARSASSRSDALKRLKLLEEAQGSETDELDIDQEELSLLLYCANDSIDKSSQVMLMLRVFGGLTPREIAFAFSLEKEAIRSRLLRAKRKLGEQGFPALSKQAVRERIPQILAAIYIMYNEATFSTIESSNHRHDIATIALRLADRLAVLLPLESEVHGLLSLILFVEARVAARSVDRKTLIPLPDQDRSLWSKGLISRANKHLTIASKLSEPGKYMLEAAIQGYHCDADSIEETDWNAILGLYNRLLLITSDGYVQLNRIYALSKVAGPSKALTELEEYYTIGIEENYLYLLVKSELHEQLGQRDKARDLLKRAIDIVNNEIVKDVLLERLKK